MAWVQSHQELADHPKTRRAARAAGVSMPTMVGHLHMLWWWALDHAPDGDLSRYEDADLADAAMWIDDPEMFVAAIRDCGPRGSAGFLETDGRLHDWDEYGGKYGKRVAAGKTAAKARWDKERNANAEASQSDGNANALGTQSASNAEERRGEEKEHSSTSVDTPDDGFEHFWQAWPKRNGKKLGKDKAQRAWVRLTLPERRDAYRGAKHYATASNAGLAGAKDAFRWLQGREWPDWQEPAQVSREDARARSIGNGGVA